MIVLEGPDGAGKTTLANELSKKYKISIGERGTANRDLLYTVTRQDTYTALSEAVRGDGPMKVWDRLYFSELIYHHVVGRQCEFSTIEQGFIERMIAALTCPIILCLPSFSTVRTNVVKDHQMEGVLGNLEEIYNSYQGLLDSQRFPEHTIVYDYTKDDGTLDTIDEIIEEYMLERRARQWQV